MHYVIKSYYAELYFVYSKYIITSASSNTISTSSNTIKEAIKNYILGFTLDISPNNIFTSDYYLNGNVLYLETSTQVTKIGKIVLALSDEELKSYKNDYPEVFI